MRNNKSCFTDKFSRQAFLRQHRLLSADEFSRVFKKPFRSSDRYLTILAVVREKSGGDNIEIENTDRLSARLGLAISKKNAKRAVDRNRIKRLIRESFRQNKHKLPAIDLVVMAKPITKNADNAQIFQSLEAHWNKLARNFKA
ncbi:Ribonuclease P protein component [hydrothermal vent metagenome]|uniref:Ribonuclease P protein component n=1 Tax=hydrothermal vent metagenome TaxID=652676 RepID=A0A3B0XVN3_9ZZZZ